VPRYSSVEVEAALHPQFPIGKLNPRVVRCVYINPDWGNPKAAPYIAHDGTFYGHADSVRAPSP
jgi:hypothetical protein